MGFSLKSLTKGVKNIGNAAGDLVNNPLKAIKDGANDKATLSALAAAAGGYGLYQAGMLGGTGGGLGGLFGGGAGTTAGAGLGELAAADAAGGLLPQFGTTAAYNAGIGTAAAGGAAAASPGWMSYLTSPQGAAQVLGGVSGLLQSNAVGDAAKQQREATQTAIAEQQRQFDLTRGDYAPYRSAGTAALGQLATDINTMPTAAEVMAQPGYQFGLTQGQTALDRKYSALGGRASGAALKSAAQYATDYATTGYNAEYQRRQDRLNRLASLAGLGQTATAGSAQAGSNAANAISGLINQNGITNSSESIARGNIWGNYLNQTGAQMLWNGGQMQPNGRSTTYG